MSKFIRLHDRGRPILIPVSEIRLVHTQGHLTVIQANGIREQMVDERVEEVEALLNFDPAVADIVIGGNHE